ncbi:MAG: hypothetical protein ACI4F4_01985 [Lachnospiraceae bacterium]
MNTTNPFFYHLYKNLFLFIAGGFTYFYIEIAFRGYSHYSMIICAGLAFIICGNLKKIFKRNISFVTQMLLSCVVITTLEFITGYIVNIKLKMNVWDYSGLPYNFMGQICLFYSLLWLCLSIICILMYDFICYYIFDEAPPHYHII